MDITDIIEKIIPIIHGFEKDPSDKLVISIEVRQVSITVLQELFNDDLIGGELPIKKKHIKGLYDITGILLDPKKLDLFIGLYADNEEGKSIKLDKCFIPPKRFAKDSPFANLVPIKPR